MTSRYPVVVFYRAGGKPGPENLKEAHLQVEASKPRVALHRAMVMATYGTAGGRCQEAWIVGAQLAGEPVQA